ncbi:MAG: hypothetical protein NZM04_01740 [Methylacidiphilales bacterium]|nr:hypothetical protein [Candidatus Methylacidiphilales bacterium]
MVSSFIFAIFIYFIFVNTNHISYANSPSYVFNRLTAYLHDQGTGSFSADISSEGTLMDVIVNIEKFTGRKNSSANGLLIDLEFTRSNKNENNKNTYSYIDINKPVIATIKTKRKKFDRVIYIDDFQEENSYHYKIYLSEEYLCSYIIIELTQSKKRIYRKVLQFLCGDYPFFKYEIYPGK